MNDLGVPCPACGSLEVEVGRRADGTEPRDAAPAASRGHVPRLHDCSCRGCNLTFRHDFAFTR